MYLIQNQPVYAWQTKDSPSLNEIFNRIHPECRQNLKNKFVYLEKITSNYQTPRNA